jgi:hypothetical protein
MLKLDLVATSSQMPLSLFRNCPDWLNSNQSTRCDEASIHGALWNELLPLCSQERQDVSRSLLVVSCLLLETVDR